MLEPPPLDGRCNSCVACRKIYNMQSHNFMPFFQVVECVNSAFGAQPFTEMRQLLHLPLSSSVVLFLWVCPCCSRVSLKLTVLGSLELSGTLQQFGCCIPRAALCQPVCCGAFQWPQALWQVGLRDKVMQVLPEFS